MADAAGPLDEPRCVPLPGSLLGNVSGAPNLTWDGERFAFLTAPTGERRQLDLYLNAFDEDGRFVVWGARPSLAYDQGDEVLHAYLIAVGPNDYVVVYVVLWTGATRIARFSVVPL